MNLVSKLTAISIQITGLAIAIAIPISGSIAQVQQVAQALSPEQINLRAKQITVRIDGFGIGSGVIINQSDNTYTVLTNWHVVKNPGQYTVQTIDGRKHPVNYTEIQQLSELDLAIVKFSTNQNYQVADIGNSARLIEGQNIYFTGYPGELRQEDNRYYRFFPANLVGVLPKSTKNGYSLIYNGEAFPGMSGGPVLDNNALLVGIHGEANIHAITGATSNYAIPINLYKRAIANNVNNNSVATISPQPASNEINPPAENQPNPPAITVETNNSNTVLSSGDTETNADNQLETNPNSDSAQSTNVTNQESAETNPEAAEATQSVAQKDESSNSAQSTNATNPESPETNPETAEATQSVAQKDESSNSAQSTNATNPEAAETTQSVAQKDESSETVVPETAPLISLQTGIDYTTLRRLLSEQKWSEADRQTDYLINEIIKTAKRSKPHTFIELKSLTDFACNDINTINQLWQEYSEGSFGFNSQQKIWLTVNEHGDFSTETWRNFATLVGWKQGDIESSRGYLLYEQLTFDPQKAPTGHLPWWFASSQEQQNLIKYVFNRCHFDTAKKDDSTQ